MIGPNRPTDKMAHKQNMTYNRCRAFIVTMTISMYQDRCVASLKSVSAFHALYDVFKCHVTIFDFMSLDNSMKTTNEADIGYIGLLSEN